MVPASCWPLKSEIKERYSRKFDDRRQGRAMRGPRRGNHGEVGRERKRYAAADNDNYDG